MEMVKGIVGTSDQVDHEEMHKDLKDLEYGGDFVAKCRQCDKELFTVVKVSPRPAIIHGVEKPKQKFQSNCPFCGEKSWVVKAEGTLMCAPADGVVLVSTDMVDSSEELFNKLVLEKVK